MIAALLLALSLPATLQDAAQDVVARVDGQPLSSAAFDAWLHERLGREYVLDFAVEHALEVRAGELGVVPSDEQVLAAYEASVQSIVDNIYKGDRALFEKSVEADGETLELRQRRLLPGMRVHLTAQAIVLATRVVDAGAVRARFEVLYGQGGEITRLEVLFFSAWKDSPGEGVAVDPVARRAQAVARASAARERLAAGWAFASVLADSDPPGSDFVKDGVVPVWRHDLLGKEVQRAVEQLDRPGELSPPVEAWDGAWLVRLVSRAPVSFDAVRAEIEQELRDAPVDGAEEAVVRRQAEQRVEVLLR
ncbi:MAG: hypothetical protein FJ296_05000 [Planctomycetes bacterium]|nr:hypothetical protein [Planctomycetota bacterium]